MPFCISDFPRDCCQSLYFFIATSRGRSGRVRLLRMLGLVCGNKDRIAVGMVNIRALKLVHYVRFFFIPAGQLTDTWIGVPGQINFLFHVSEPKPLKQPNFQISTKKVNNTRLLAERLFILHILPPGTSATFFFFFYRMNRVQSFRGMESGRAPLGEFSDSLNRILALDLQCYYVRSGEPHLMYMYVSHPLCASHSDRNRRRQPLWLE